MHTKPDSFPQCHFISSPQNQNATSSVYDISPPGLISNNKLLSFLVIKFTPLFVLFLALNMKSPCYPGKGQHRNAVSTEILMVHTVLCLVLLPIAVLYWVPNHPLMLRALEHFHFFSLLPPHLLAW